MNKYQEDFIYTDNDGNAQIDWKKYEDKKIYFTEQVKKEMLKNVINPNQKFSLRG